MNSGPDDALLRANGPQGRSKADTLRYVSELSVELKQLAEKSGCTTLAGILALAQVEARIQARESED